MVSKDHYYKLASNIADERVSAAQNLVQELVASGTEDDWKYAINRLIRGLSSPRDSSRLGFTMTLMELLDICTVKNSKYYLTVEEFLQMLNDTTKVASSMSGREVKNVLLGKLMGLKCLAETQNLIAKSEHVVENYTLFLEECLNLAQTKVWLVELCISHICNLLSQVIEINKKDSITITEGVIKITFEAIEKHNFSETPDGIAVFLTVPSKFRSLAVPFWSHNHWKNGNPMSSGNSVLLSKVLKNANIRNDSEENATKKKKETMPRVKLHSVWKLLAKELTLENTTTDEETKISKKRKKNNNKSDPISTSNEHSNISLIEFWRVVVDESLFSQKSSTEKKSWGFQIFSEFLQLSQPSQIPCLFEKNLFRCFINQSSNSDGILHAAAKKALNEVEQISALQPAKCPILFEQLVSGKHGFINFDIVSKSKTTDNLLKRLQPEYIPSIIQLLNDLIEKAEKDTEENEKEKQRKQIWILDTLLHLTRYNKLAIREEPSNDLIKAIDSILSLMTSVGFFNNSKFEISENVAKVARGRLNSILGELISYKRPDGTSWPFKVLNFLLETQNNGKPEKTLRIEFEGDLTVLLEKSLKRLMKIRKKRFSSSKKNSPQLYAFELLYSMTLLQFYSGDDLEAPSVLEELELCYNSSIGKSKGKEGGDEEIDSAQVLTEIIIGFISGQSSLLKRLSATVWKCFCMDVNKESLGLLYDILKAKENKEGQSSLFDSEGAHNGDSDEEEVDGEFDEMDVDQDSEESSLSDSDSDIYNASSSDSEVDNKVAEVDKKANIALAKALGITQSEDVSESNLQTEDDASSSSSESSSSEESMDDEQMMAMDETLSMVFKARKEELETVVTGNKRKLEVEDARQNMIHLKTRILELLEIFIEVNPQSPLILTMIEPVIAVIKITLNKKLGEKAHALLKTKICKTKLAEIVIPSNAESLNPKDDYLILGSEHIKIHDILNQLLTFQSEATRSSVVAHGNSCSQASLFLAKILLAYDFNIAIDNIVDIYSKSLKKWVCDKRNKIQPTMFFELINWLKLERKNKHAAVKDSELKNDKNVNTEEASVVYGQVLPPTDKKVKKKKSKSKKKNQNGLTKKN